MRRMVAARVTRSAMVVVLTAGLLGGTRAALPVRADFDTGGDCMTGWRSEGFSTAMGQALDLPFESLVGEPWASSLIDDTPRAESRGSLYYEGPIGQLVIGTTSKGTPDNPFDARALYPAPGGALGESHAVHDYGPMQRTEAQAQPGKATADARVLGVSAGPDSGTGALAHSDATYTGDAIHGSNMSAAYDVNLGAVHIALMRSLLQWKSDGSDAGTTATFTLQFHGVTVNGQPVSSSSGDGFTFSNQAPSPGPAAHKQFEDQVKQFADALQKGGAGQYQIVISEGRMNVSAGQIDIDELGFKAEMAPSPLKTSAAQGASWQFGRTVEQVQTSRGPCDAVRQLPPYTDKAPAAGPGLPPPPGQHPQGVRGFHENPSAVYAQTDMDARDPVAYRDAGCVCTPPQRG